MKKLIRHFNLRFISLAIVVIGFQSCSEDKEGYPVVPVTNQRGEILQTNSLGNYSVSNIQQIMSSGNITIPFTLTYSVNAISINYYTIDGKGKESVASGALLIPQGINNLPLVSIQHGTQTKDNLVASVSPMNSTEGIVGLIMASMVYMVVVPDYPGFGVSNIIVPPSKLRAKRRRSGGRLEHAARGGAPLRAVRLHAAFAGAIRSAA